MRHAQPKILPIMEDIFEVVTDYQTISTRTIAAQFLKSNNEERKTPREEQHYLYQYQRIQALKPEDHLSRGHFASGFYNSLIELTMLLNYFLNRRDHIYTV